jgi:excisionase family DNA binding protein
MSTQSQTTEEMKMPRLLLTPTEAAETLGIGRSKLYELLRAGAVESVLIGTARRIPADALAAYIAGLREQVAG